MTLNIPNSIFKALGIFLFGAVIGLGVGIGPQHVHFPQPHPAPPPRRLPPAPAPAPAPTPAKPDWFGLVYPPDAPAVVGSLPKFRAVAQGLMGARDANDNRPILLYKAWTDLFAAYPPYPAQQIGDCTSFGHGHANDLAQCIGWILGHPRSQVPTANDIQETDTEALYAMGRQAGNMLFTADGCYGAAIVKAMTTMGVVSRRQVTATLGPGEGTYSGQRARQWGRKGAPDTVQAVAAKYKLGSAAQVTTWDELVAALHNGSPVTICSNQGFNLTRDSQGFCRAQGRWGHCMFVAGVRFDRPGACIIQSWGSNQPAGPTGARSAELLVLGRSCRDRAHPR